MQIEAAIVSAEHIGGFITDIEKCINFLERPWVTLIATHLGVAPTILRAWLAFLGSISRCFVINDWIGQENFSTSGFPKGDSLSCVALVSMIFALYHYMIQYMPSITTWSYIDNLQVVGHHAGSIQQAFLVMSTWTDLFGLRLDTAKTLYWASDRDLRSQLAHLDLTVVESAKDLGISMVYGSRLRDYEMLPCKIEFAVWSLIGLAYVGCQCRFGTRDLPFGWPFCPGHFMVLFMLFLVELGSGNFALEPCEPCVLTALELTYYERSGRVLFCAGLPKRLMVLL